jgi:hypothetical protein
LVGARRASSLKLGDASLLRVVPLEFSSLFVILCLAFASCVLVLPLDLGEAGEAASLVPLGDSILQGPVLVVLIVRQEVDY